MAVATHQRKSWTASDYILAALGCCLAAAVIVIIVSAILSPGRIIFSVTHASGSRSNSTGGVNLKLTVSANSTSHRAMVKYSSFFVMVGNSDDPTPQIITHAQVDTSNFLKDDYLSAPSVISINVNASVSDFTGHLLPRTVVLTTQVRFKIGVATTKVYYIKVFCPGVVFPVEGSRSPNTCDG